MRSNLDRAGGTPVEATSGGGASVGGGPAAGACGSGRLRDSGAGRGGGTTCEGGTPRVGGTMRGAGRRAHGPMWGRERRRLLVAHRCRISGRRAGPSARTADHLRLGRGCGECSRAIAADV